MSKAARLVRNDDQKKVINALDRLTGRYSMWELWQDFIVMSACAIANVFPHPNREKREKEYEQRASRYKPEEIAVFSECLMEVADAMERNPDQDFLGELFMALGISDRWKGQFFTPYNVCRMMATMTFGEELKQKAAERGWIGVNDPACGAGALLLAFANECHRQHFNDQDHVLYVAQDIDYLAGCMCYIQLSLMGCPGYVVIGDSICHPSTPYDERGLIPRDEGNVWYTPMYFSGIWQGRVLWTQMDLLVSAGMNDPGPSAEADAPGPSIAGEPPQIAAVELQEQASGQLTLF